MKVQIGKVEASINLSGPRIATGHQPRRAVINPRKGVTAIVELLRVMVPGTIRVPTPDWPAFMADWKYIQARTETPESISVSELRAIHRAYEKAGYYEEDRLLLLSCVRVTLTGSGVEATIAPVWEAFHEDHEVAERWYEASLQRVMEGKLPKGLTPVSGEIKSA